MISRTAAPDTAAPRTPRRALRTRERGSDRRGPAERKWSKESATMSPLNNLPGPALSLGSVRASYGRPGPDPHRPGPHPPGVVAGPGGTPVGSRGAASPAVPVRRRGRGARRCPDSRRDLARRLSRRRPRAGGAPGPRMQDRREREYRHRDEDSHGPGDEDDDEPTVRSTPPAPGQRGPGWRDPAPGRIRGRGGSGAGLRNSMSAQRNYGAGSSAGRGWLA